MTELSSQAQAVMTAVLQLKFGEESDLVDFPRMSRILGPELAAALRAAANQVVPKLPMIVEGGRTYEEAWTATVHADIRRRFLAIADDLEPLNDLHHAY